MEIWMLLERKEKKVGWFFQGFLDSQGFFDRRKDIALSKAIIEARNAGEVLEVF